MNSLIDFLTFVIVLVVAWWYLTKFVHTGVAGIGF